MANENVSVKVDLDLVMRKKFFKIAPSFDEFVKLVEAAGVDVSKYDAVLSIQPKE